MSVSGGLTGVGEWWADWCLSTSPKFSAGAIGQVP